MLVHAARQRTQPRRPHTQESGLQKRVLGPPPLPLPQSYTARQKRRFAAPPVFGVLTATAHLNSRSTT
eukprot:scaffold12954_cov105-Isochrysis_galbana.AAC.5